MALEHSAGIKMGYIQPASANKEIRYCMADRPSFTSIDGRSGFRGSLGGAVQDSKWGRGTLSIDRKSDIPLTEVDLLCALHPHIL